MGAAAESAQGGEVLATKGGAVTNSTVARRGGRVSPRSVWQSTRAKLSP
jgi:hypothetical protein